MKVLSWNVNGLRSVAKKGFLDWLDKANPDILCLQEIKSQKDDLNPDLINPPGYFSFLNSALKKGYSGVLVYAKQKPKEVKTKLGFRQFDQEGRFLELKYSNFTLINLYLPHGGRQKEKLPYKLEAYHYFLKYLEKFKKEKLVLVGDFNIAHQEIDLARPKQNKNNIMFTPEERNQIDKILSLGFSDAFRLFNQKTGNFSWWPYFANARQRNLGWRIDYSFVSDNLKNNVKKAFLLPEVLGSDHCPVGLEIIT